MWNSPPANSGANSSISADVKRRTSGLVTSSVEPAISGQSKRRSGRARRIAAACAGISISGMIVTWYRRAASSKRRMSALV